MEQRIEHLQRESVATPGVLSLAGGLPAPETFPQKALAKALGQIPREALQYDWPEGREPLRRWITERLTRRGVAVRPEEILLTGGAQQALDIAVQLTGAEGHRVCVPDPCYPGALDLFSGHGCQLVRAGASSELEYTMPALQNPVGVPASAAELERMLADEHWLLEDDAYAELRFDGLLPAPLLALARERVFHVGTLSKTLCPGLRVGWLVAPPEMVEAARRAKARIDLQGNTFAQSVVERYLEHEDYDARLAWLRAFYARNADALMHALRRHLRECQFDEPRGGFSLWVTTSEMWDDVELLRVALTHGTGFDPGSTFRRDHARQPFSMRLAFSSIPPGDMEEAVKRLARAFREVRPAVRHRRRGRAGRGE